MLAGYISEQETHDQQNRIVEMHGKAVVAERAVARPVGWNFFTHLHVAYIASTFTPPQHRKSGGLQTARQSSGFGLGGGCSEVLGLKLQ